MVRPILLAGLSSVCRWRQSWAMASVLYLAFVPLLQLLRLLGCDGDELAIEVVMLRHEVAVLHRKVAPSGWPSDRALFAGLGRLLGHRTCPRGSDTPDRKSVV